MQIDTFSDVGFNGVTIKGELIIAPGSLYYFPQIDRSIHGYALTKGMALLSAFFGLVSTAVFAVAAQLFYFAPSFMVRGPEYLKPFSADQVNSLAFLSLRFSGYGGALFMVFYGLASILRGYLIFKSGYLPKVLGVLLALGGLGFVMRNFVFVLAPAYASDLLLPPMIIAMLALALWLLLKGVDTPKWEEQARVSRRSGA